MRTTQVNAVRTFNLNIRARYQHVDVVRRGLFGFFFIWLTRGKAYTWLVNGCLIAALTEVGATFFVLTQELIMKPFVLFVVCLLCFSAALAAQDAAKPTYVLEPANLDFGTLTEPGVLRETVVVKGLGRADRLALEVHRGVGVAAQQTPLTSDGRRGFDVYLTSVNLEAGEHTDSVSVRVNDEEIGVLNVRMVIREAASRAALTRLTVFAREGDPLTASLQGVQQALSGQANPYPNMRYSLDIKLIHVKDNRAAYDRLFQEYQRATGATVTREWPAMFLGPRLIAAGDSNVDATLSVAVHGQDFLRPMPVVSVLTAEMAQKIETDFIGKVRTTPPQVVWIPRKVAPEQLAGNEFIVDFPTPDGKRAQMTGKLPELDAKLRQLLGKPLPAPDAGTDMSSPNIRSSGTTAVPAVMAPDTKAGADAHAEQQGSGFSIVWVALIIGALALILGVVMFSAMRKQQAVLNYVSQRLDKPADMQRRS